MFQVTAWQDGAARLPVGLYLTPLSYFDRIRPCASSQTYDVMGKMQSGILHSPERCVLNGCLVSEEVEAWLYLAATAEGCFTMTLISFRAGTARAHFLKSVWNFNRRPRKAGSRSKLGFKCVCGRMK